ncbi:hypothetical protein DV737_g2492, partial [Chaetothyriales sp. CBS 132003]
MASQTFTKIGKSGTWKKLVVEDISDGEQRYWPSPPYRPSSEEVYLATLGEAWARDTGQAQSGINYFVDRLPSGYGSFHLEKAGSGGSIVYKRVFGHPSGRYYDSAKRFAVHFLWLMTGMSGNCTCVLCNPTDTAHLSHRPRGGLAAQPAKKRRNVVDVLNMPHHRPSKKLAPEEGGSSTRESSATGIATGRSRREARQPGGVVAVDEEGTEDVYKKFLQQLERAKDSVRGIDFDFEEDSSIDWRAEHECSGLGSDQLQRYLTQVQHQHSFVPRVGELVLWCPNFPDHHHLVLNHQTGRYMFYSFEQVAWHGYPEWRAGVVTAVPTKVTQNGTIDFPDILDTPPKTTALSTSGFRVETFPDPNNELDKSASKQYKFVPLRNIRPLSHWQILLRKLPEKDISPSIKHALTCMTTISLVEKVKAVGRWPSAHIMCKAVYLGAELITTGDVIRLAPQGLTRIYSDVMIVESIRLNLDEIQSEHVLPSSQLLCTRSSITFVGIAYSLAVPADQDVSAELHIIKPTPVASDIVKTYFRPVGSTEYGEWYHLHDSHQRFEVSHDQVLGRLYEADAVRLWTGQLQHKLEREQRRAEKPCLSFDAAGILTARRYATQTDNRIPEPSDDEFRWFLADNRAQALDVASFNGIEVGNYDPVRTKATLEYWKAQMAILNGKTRSSATSGYVSFDVLPSYFGDGRRGRKPGSKVVNGRVVFPGDPNYPGARPGGETESEEGDDEDEDEDVKPVPTSAMAGAALTLTDEEGSEAIEDDIDGANMAQKPVRKMSGTGLKKSISQPDRKESLTRGEIAQSVEAAEEFDREGDMHVDQEDDDPWPAARGGTEESDGGDYNPLNSQG